MLKTAHLAEAFHMNYEVHHGGNSLNNLAQLHFASAIRNTTYFEVLLPHGGTDPAWVALSRSLTVKKKHARIQLRDSKQTFTFVTLWISRAPQASIGTPEAPGHVDVNELELFPAGQ